MDIQTPTISNNLAIGKQNPAGKQAITARTHTGSFGDYYQQRIEQENAFAARQKAAEEKAANTAAEHQALVTELSDYLKKSPAQHLREAVMKELGITEEELAKMPPAKRQAMEKEITERIRERLAGTEKNHVRKTGELEQGRPADSKLTAEAPEEVKPTNPGTSSSFFSSFFNDLLATEAKP